MLSLCDDLLIYIDVFDINIVELLYFYYIIIIY